MSGSDDCHQQKARHLHGQAAVNSIGFRRRHPDACSLLSFSSRTVMAINSKRVDRRNRAANRNCTPTCETIGVNVELTCNVRPDISGQVTIIAAYDDGFSEGALSRTKINGRSNEMGEVVKANYSTIRFDASRSSALNGKSITVQPSSFRLMPIIKS